VRNLSTLFAGIWSRGERFWGVAHARLAIGHDELADAREGERVLGVFVGQGGEVIQESALAFLVSPLSAAISAASCDLESLLT